MLRGVIFTPVSKMPPPLAATGEPDASYCQAIVNSPMDEGLADSKTPDAGWGVAAKPQTRVSGKQRATTRSRIDHRADRPGGEMLFLLAAPIIQQLFKQLKRRTRARIAGRSEGRLRALRAVSLGSGRLGRPFQLRRMAGRVDLFQLLDADLGVNLGRR